LLWRRSLPLVAAAALLAAGCGTPPGPSAAENSALNAIGNATTVLSYPIPASSLERYLPSAEIQSLGAPTYLFAVQVKGRKQPTWVVAGQKSAYAPQVYKDIAGLASHASRFALHGEAGALRVLAKAPVGKVPLQVVGVRVERMTSKALGHLGVKVPPGTYTVVSVLSIPPELHASTASVANFVLAGGKVIGEFGTDR
jgi:hypothetical protein